MGEYKREIGRKAKRFTVGHRIFDNIVDINYGTSILMLDETFSEANKLLKMLLRGNANRTGSQFFEVVPHSSLDVGGNVIEIGDEPLTNISININKLRRRFNNLPFIYTVLPDMIIKNQPDDILRLLMAWQKNIRENGTIEFYILPKDTFQDLERKILSIVDGAIEVRVDQANNRYRSYLKPIRCCKPEFHLKEFQYRVESGRILIQWKDRFTDELFSYDLEEISSRVEDYNRNLRFLKITRGEKSDSQLSVYDYWMVSQIQDKLLSEIKEIFPEKFDWILEKIASWQISDVIRVVKTTDLLSSTASQKIRVSKITRIALNLPTWLTTMFIRFRTGRPRTTPLDAYLYNRKATLAFIKMLFSTLDLQEADYTDRLLEMQKRFNEMGARETAVKHTKLLGENASLKLDMVYFPKILDLTFNTTYRVKPLITKVSETEYLLKFRECFECNEVSYSKPICSAIEGIVEGICGAIFKIDAKCKEIECKALKDQACLFKTEFKYL